MKISKLFALTTATALLAGGSIVCPSHAAAKDTLPRHRLGGGKLLERAKDKLGLTEEQITQIKAVIKSEREKITGLLTQMHAARAGLREAIRDGEATEASVRAAAATVAGVEADVAVERMKLFRQISPLLTEAQREKLKNFQARVDELIDTAISRAGERLAE